MSSVLAFMVAIIISMPLFFYVLLYIWFHKWTKNKRKALRGAVHLSAPVIVLSVYLLLNVLTGSGYVGWIVIVLLVLVGISFIIQYKIVEELRFGKTFKGFLRLTFLVFSFVYVFLFMYGMVIRVILPS